MIRRKVLRFFFVFLVFGLILAVAHIFFFFGAVYSAQITGDVIAPLRSPVSPEFIVVLVVGFIVVFSASHFFSKRRVTPLAQKRFIHLKPHAH